MFTIPILGARLFTNRVPPWVIALSALGFLSTAFTFALNAYPFDGSSSPLPFATEILGATALINLAGYLFYRLRKPTI